MGDGLQQRAWTAKGRTRAAVARAVVVALLAGSAGVVSASPASADPVGLSVTITRITHIGTDIDPGITQGPVGDFYAGVTIDGVRLDNFDQRLGFGFEFGTGFIFPYTIEPAWRGLGRTVDDGAGAASVEIEIWDNDDCDSPFCTDPGFLQNADDRVDANPGAPEGLSLSVDLATGEWAGDVDHPEHCSRGTGGEAVEVCFEISLLSTTGDLDGDGLLDTWETEGVDVDYDGTVDVDLPGFGADPTHKDLFVELDAMAGNQPSRAAILRMKAAFNTAPVDAGTDASDFPGGLDAQSNPDGQPGVRLWVDTGTLADPNASEDGQGSGTCGDGIDNVGDGATDASDTDCLVGDDLGGGNAVAASAVPYLDGSFYAVKRANFDPARRWVFRYGLSAAPGFEDGSTAGNSCLDGVDNGGGDEDSDGTAEVDGNDPDCYPWGGGWGELGGNDFVEYNHNGGTIMHELGHLLNLRHGGFEDANCKPNYLSVMNYDNQGGINLVGGGSILDFSPPRLSSGRGTVPLPTLDEDDLDESLVLDPTDDTNMFVFKNMNGRAVQWPLDQPVDWNGDGIPPGAGTPASDVTVNVDTADNQGTATTADDSPQRCRNSATDSVLRGSDDWSRISLPFRQFGDNLDAGVDVVPEPEVTLPELERLEEALNTTDVALDVVADPDPVAAGSQLTYTFTVTNNGPNPANEARVVQTLAPETTYASAGPGCSATGSTVTCQLDAVPAGEQRQVAVTVGVAADVVYANGGPKTITSSASVENLAGPDPTAGNDLTSTDTLVVGVSDVGLADVTPIAPAAVLVGTPQEVTLDKVLTNGGPSSPVDVIVDATASASPGVSVSPASSTSTVTGLAEGAPRTLSETFTIECQEPGLHTFTFVNEVRLAAAADTDPDLSDNRREVNVTVDCVIPVALNISPGGSPNSLNLQRGGVAPVAVLTTEAGEYGLPLAFDAGGIEPLTARFGPESLLGLAGGGAPELHGRGHLEDSYELDEVTRDGDADMVLHFRPADSGLSADDGRACVLGRWTDAEGRQFTFFGCDDIRVVPPR